MISGGSFVDQEWHKVDISIEGASSSIDDQTPHEVVESSDPYTTSSVAAIVVMIQPKDEEHPQKILWASNVHRFQKCIEICRDYC